MKMMELEVKEAFEKAKKWIKENIPELGIFADEISLEFTRSKDGYDLRRNLRERKILVNLYRIEWYLEREKICRLSPKYDIETALIHEIFEYCYLRKHNYPEDDPAINLLVHRMARSLENSLRDKKGLKPWI
ncbi:MAG: hypothetical protein DRP00_06285 [Candidatus Aenigmatarchaeota archaeon]|nr:MAG: hypothetical protein DRP00_06285 [Candidatus Aenigmarchaeota archaeon]